jgi:hypothetical protein
MITRYKSKHGLFLMHLNEDCMMHILSFCKLREMLLVRLSCLLKTYSHAVLAKMDVCYDKIYSEQLLSWVIHHCPLLKLPPRNNVVASLMNNYFNHPFCQKFCMMDLSLVSPQVCKDEKMQYNYWWMKDIVINGNLWKKELYTFDWNSKIDVSQCRLIINGGNFAAFSILQHFNNIHTLILTGGSFASLISNTHRIKHLYMFDTVKFCDVCLHNELFCLCFFQLLECVHHLHIESSDVLTQWSPVLLRSYDLCCRSISMPNMPAQWKEFMQINEIEVIDAFCHDSDIDYFRHWT